MKVNFIKTDWAYILKDEIQKSYMKKLFDFLKEEYKKGVVFPPKGEVFTAFNLTSYENTKVVILGQDPYHGQGQAHGLSFSVKKGIPSPPSLSNIFKELTDDIGCNLPKNGDLTKWATEGVLMLNTTLTVRSAQPMSHSGYGWETFTDFVLKVLSAKKEPVVFILWGKHAQSKIKIIDRERHFIISSPHPSPLSSYRGFFGSKPFSKANDFLESNGVKGIDWSLDS